MSRTSRVNIGVINNTTKTEHQENKDEKKQFSQILHRLYLLVNFRLVRYIRPFMFHDYRRENAACWVTIIWWKIFQLTKKQKQKSSSSIVIFFFKKTTFFAMFAVCFPREVILCPELCGDLSALQWRRQMMMSVCSIPRFVEARAPNTHCVSILYYIIVSPCPWLIIYTITPKNALWTHSVISDTSPQTFNGRTSHTYRQSWV